MINYELWRQKLQTDMGSQLRKYGFASEIKAVLANATKAPPALFVIPRDEKVSSLNSTGSQRDFVTGGIDILIIVADFTDAYGGKANQSLTAIRDGIYASLRGWTPPDCQDTISFRSGKRAGMYKGLLLWSDTYECKTIKG